MPLKLDEIKQLHDKAYVYNQITRERAADDLVFYWITQWDDQVLSETQLAYRGEFNILRKAGRHIESDLASNPTQLDFQPKGETAEDAAIILDGIYRTEDNHNTTIYAYKNAKTEAMVCGVGAWELHTEYLTMSPDNRDQVIRRRAIPEANNTVYWDPNAKELDKSDANHCSVLVAYTVDGYQEMVEDLTGDVDSEMSDAIINQDAKDEPGTTFKEPEISYVFPWLGGTGQIIWISNFYHREKIKTKIYTLIDSFGDRVQMWESDLDGKLASLEDDGFEVESEKEVYRWEITKYIVSGTKIISQDVIAGQNIPIIPIFGERAYVEGEEHYEGITRLAKDPSRLRNLGLSYLADIVSRSPRAKPAYWPEQIKSHEWMYEENGADNNLPYVYMNRLTEGGDELPIGPVALAPSQEMPVALADMINLTREAVSDVAEPGIPRDIADVDLSGVAVGKLQNRLDMQSQIYQENNKHAKRRDGEVYASMASEIYDTPRKVKLTMPDGTVKNGDIMEQVFDEDANIKTVADLHNAEFEVYGTIGPKYSSQKEQEKADMKELYQNTPDGDPMKRVLLLTIITMSDGETDQIRKYARKQLIAEGVIEPETEEEKAFYEQVQQQSDEPSAEMVLAMAEDKKGQAELARVEIIKMEAQIKLFKAKTEAQNAQGKLQVSGFEAQTNRMDTQIDAEKAGAEIEFKRIDAFGAQLDNLAKIKQLRESGNMSGESLYQQVYAE